MVISETQCKKISKGITDATNRIIQEAKEENINEWPFTSNRAKYIVKNNIRTALKNSAEINKIKDLPITLFDKCMDSLEDIDINWYLGY